MDSKIAIVIVLYNPDYRNVSNNINCLALSDKRVAILVDNTPNSICNIENTKQWVYTICNGENLGIATAQNIGIRKAKDLGCTHIVFFDQDSVVENRYIDLIYSEYIRLKEIYSNIAVLGPTVINMTTGKGYKVKNKPINNGCKILPSVISSGSIMELEIFDVIGGMEDRLFIDYVDNEWSWRATHHGYICCLTTAVSLQHKIGQKDYVLLGIPFLVSSPIRYYYQYRNFIWLLRRPYVPFEWKLKSLIRKIVELIVIPCLATNALYVVKYMWRGIYDGLLKR